MSTINPSTLRQGNKDAEIKFGHIHSDGKISAFLVRSGTEPNHYISMDSEGEPHRKHGTICRSTGAFQIKAGDNVKNTGLSENVGVYIEAVDGDIILNAKNGRVRIIGENIDLISRGSDGQNGNISIDANEKVIVNAPTVTINSKVLTRIVSENRVELIGKAILNCYGGLIDFADGATKINNSKGGSMFEGFFK
jgi:hypothetical protein